MSAFLFDLQAVVWNTILVGPVKNYFAQFKYSRSLKSKVEGQNLIFTVKHCLKCVTSSFYSIGGIFYVDVEIYK